jgi:hypothetical protein
MNKSGTRVRYRTNTVRGSSGSPCFTPVFDVVALHHTGDPNFAAGHAPGYNQGVPMHLIAAHLKERGLAAGLVS